MASRRRYRTDMPKGYFTGGAVPVTADVPVMDAAPLPEHEPDLVEIANAATHADELQRQQSPFEAQIDAMPISDFKKKLLKQYPELAVDAYKAKLAGEYHAAALREGIEDDSPEIADAILAGVQRHLARQHELSLENVKRDAESAMPVVPDRAAHQDRGIGNADAPARAIMPERRRSIPMSAPVSRDVPTASGKRTSSLTDVRLSPDERQIAVTSFPHMSKAQAEYEYFQNKRKMLGMKERGEIQ